MARKRSCQASMLSMVASASATVWGRSRPSRPWRLMPRGTTATVASSG